MPTTYAPESVWTTQREPDGAASRAGLGAVLEGSGRIVAKVAFRAAS